MATAAADSVEVATFAPSPAPTGVPASPAGPAPTAAPTAPPSSVPSTRPTHAPTLAQTPPPSAPVSSAHTSVPAAVPTPTPFRARSRLPQGTRRVGSCRLRCRRRVPQARHRPQHRRPRRRPRQRALWVVSVSQTPLPTISEMASAPTPTPTLSASLMREDEGVADCRRRVALDGRDLSTEVPTQGPSPKEGFGGGQRL